MRRRIEGFTRDDAGDLVAHLSCGHRQHVLHRPPFQVRPWVQDEEGRRSRIGAELECPLCQRAELPEGLTFLRRSPTWKSSTLPPGLRGDHRLGDAIWAVLVVEAGPVRFTSPVLGDPDPPLDMCVPAGTRLAIPPLAEHRVRLGDGARIHLLFHRVTPVPKLLS